MEFERKSNSNKIQANKPTAGSKNGPAFNAVIFSMTCPENRLIKTKNTIPVYIIPMGKNREKGKNMSRIC